MLHVAPFVLAAAAAASHHGVPPRLVLYEEPVSGAYGQAGDAAHHGWTPLRMAAPSARVRGPAGMPACAGEVCQPRVAVPGHEPTYSLHGKRTELAVLYLRRFHVEPVATVAGWLALTGVRLDFTPPQFEPGSNPTAHPGWGRFTVYVRWRLDANNAPVFWHG